MSKMKKMAALWLAAVLLTGLLSGCGTNLTSMIESGADRFAEGKLQEDYNLKGADVLLQEMLEKYTGSRNQPVVFQEPAGAGENIEDAQFVAVSCEADLIEAFHEAYRNTAQQLKVAFLNGYTVDLAQTIPDIYDQIQRLDPLHANGVKGWWPHETDDGYAIDIIYYFSRSELLRMKEETSRLVTEVAQQIGQTANTDYERICEVNRYLCDKVVYPEKEPYAPVTHTPYGALKNGLAVCDGYSAAALLILEELGIDCDMQYGVCSNGENHAWNLVYLDGRWYQMDITWNDGSSSITEYLLVTDAFMRISRTWDYSQYPKTPLVRYRA